MNKLFYDHLIKVEKVTIELDNYELTEDERNEFISLIDETFHNRILETILSNLPLEHHESFLSRFHREPFNTELLSVLKELSSPDIEEKIKTEAEKIKKEILGEIEKSKRK